MGQGEEETEWAKLQEAEGRVGRVKGGGGAGFQAWQSPSNRAQGAWWLGEAGRKRRRGGRGVLEGCGDTLGQVRGGGETVEGHRAGSRRER